MLTINTIHKPKCQVEHFSRDVERQIKHTELEKRKRDAAAYVDPEKGAEAKDRGNEHFRAGRWPDAVKEYEEAIKRDPTNAAYHNNRAAALAKLMDFTAAKAACEKVRSAWLVVVVVLVGWCLVDLFLLTFVAHTRTQQSQALELDPKYVKAWAKKADIEMFMKEYHRAMESYKKGLVRAFVCSWLVGPPARRIEPRLTDTRPRTKPPPTPNQNRSSSPTTSSACRGCRRR